MTCVENVLFVVQKKNEEYFLVNIMESFTRKKSYLNVLYLGIEFYLFVSHGGMKRQRVHV